MLIFVCQKTVWSITKWEVSKGCNLGVMDNIKIEIKGAQKNVILLYIHVIGSFCVEIALTTSSFI